MKCHKAPGVWRLLSAPHPAEAQGEGKSVFNWGRNKTPLLFRTSVFCWPVQRTPRTHTHVITNLAKWDSGGEKNKAALFRCRRGCYSCCPSSSASFPDLTLCVMFPHGLGNDTVSALIYFSEQHRKGKTHCASTGALQAPYVPGRFWRQIFHTFKTRLISQKSKN